MKILIIDSSYLIYKSYFAFKDSHLSVQIEDKELITSAIFGYMKEVIRMKSEMKYDFLISTWDSPPYIKKQKYPSYKENRHKNKIPNLQDEREIIQGILHGLKIPCLYTTGYEAEEVMNSLKKKLKGNKIHLFTADEDCYALLSKSVSLITTRNSDIIITKKSDLKKKYGIKPKQFHLFKTLTGCKSDNVQGANGIGPKKASFLIQNYGSLKNIKTNIETFPPSIKNPLTKAFKEDIFTSSSFLTKIETPSPLFNKKPEVSLSYSSLLEFIDAKTLLKGRNKLYLKKLRKSQKANLSEFKKLIEWKIERRPK